MPFLKRPSLAAVGWGSGAVGFVLLLLLPLGFLLYRIVQPPSENWNHIQEYMLLGYTIDTLTLAVSVGVLSIALGTTLAWLISAYTFPFRNTLKWALLMPLAIPPYIGAYAYHGMLNYTGFIQRTLRTTFDIEVSQRYFDIMNIPGAVFIYTIFLYPYVYAITRAFFARQATTLIENARVLGSGPVRTFFRIVLPVSRAAIVGGVTLVMLEVLNDYGLVNYFGIQTFSTAIFQTWYALDDLNSAIRLAGILMGIVLVFLLLEKVFRGRQQYSYTSAKASPLKPQVLEGWKKWTALSFSGVVFLLGFILPIFQLLYWGMLTYEAIFSAEFVSLIRNSTIAAGISSLLVVVFAVIIANFTRVASGWFSTVIARFTVLGYSIPGAVIAVGVISFFLYAETQLQLFYAYAGISTELMLSTSLVMLVFAYVIRFMAVGYNSIESGFEKIGRRYSEASRTLGMGWIKTFFKVDLPMIRAAVFSGFILVFVDILKELPLTLILRPFNFETLATTAYRYASDERIQETAVPSLSIILVSAIAMFVFHILIEKEPN
ncbi:iron(III) transport system permease protein [Marinococcus luteus]|uniref:Iron(III) transport system permease protein n=1 Tax=Marinococcus luteus TaxID=1122204 RepID=A0A1H2RLX2_9BACI|nr:iron ABC transporter permease [Marinococcus luteus]SDW20170.1 iron(III) transport system permease protein [Marinococcus luteus]